MKTTTDSKNNPLAGLVHSGQEVIHNLTDHVRATADRSRRLVDTKRRYDLLRELGQVHYDAHHTGNQPDQESIDRLIAQLDTDTSGDVEHDEVNNGDQ